MPEEEKKKGKVEEAGEKTGEAIGKGAKAVWGGAKGLGRGLKKGVSKKEEEEK
jgi:hypothetical protein